MNTHFTQDQLNFISEANARFLRKLASGTQGQICDKDSSEQTRLRKQLLSSPELQAAFLQKCFAGAQS